MKKLSITIPDDAWAKIEALREKAGELNVSRLIADALGKELGRVIAQTELAATIEKLRAQRTAYVAKPLRAGYADGQASVREASDGTYDRAMWFKEFERCRKDEDYAVRRQIQGRRPESVLDALKHDDSLVFDDEMHHWLVGYCEAHDPDGAGLYDDEAYWEGFAQGFLDEWKRIEHLIEDGEQRHGGPLESAPGEPEGRTNRE